MGYKMSTGQLSETSPNSAAKSAAGPGFEGAEFRCARPRFFDYGIDMTGIYDVERVLLGRQNLFFPAVREDTIS
jgi:hypothetical protein